MTFEVFLMLLTAFSILTSLFTEAVKKFLKSLNLSYASNIVVLFVSALIGGLGSITFYLIKDYPWTTLNIIYIFLMICANWLIAMLGYDKVMQAISQMTGGNNNGN